MNLGYIVLAETPKGCIVEDDPGMVVRGARPVSEADRAAMREQMISRLLGK